MGVNLSSICCSGVFGCYNFSSVSCCKTHQLCLYPGFHHSCETLISETHSPITALADVCCLVHSPAGSWLLSWYPPGTTSNCETLVIPEMGLLWCSLGGPQCPLLISSRFPEPGKDLSPGCLGIKALLWLCCIKPWIWNRLVHHSIFPWMYPSLHSLQSSVYSLLNGLLITVFNNKIVLKVGHA